MTKLLNTMTKIKNTIKEAYKELDFLLLFYKDSNLITLQLLMMRWNLKKLERLLEFSNYITKAKSLAKTRK